jgi:predicted ATPase
VRELPTGTVTFLFTDIEGSTRLLQQLGDRYAQALGEHRRLLRAAFEHHGGVEVDTQGDAFFVAFTRAGEALAAAAEAQQALEETRIRVRMGLHTGEPLLSEEGYVGLDVHRAARIAAAGHGGQVLLSQSTRDLLDSGLELRELGEHRLKDLVAGERLWQLGDASFPPLKSLNQTNLPVQPTPLVGRERELAEVVALLGSSRLLTLTGPGGAGKTRLALQAAAEVVEAFDDGVWFVPLSALAEVELVPSSIATSVGASADLQDFLAQKRLLLLLDNCEQLLPELSRVVAELLAAPAVVVLATSRERLALGSEQEYAIPPLEIPAASALFTTRARQLDHAYEPDEHVAEIAKRLDGLPLALELAAARVKVLTTEQIRERLGQSLELLTSGARDAPARQRTLRATIAWSYELLANEERLLFSRLAVFPGSFDLEAAESICEAGLDALASLVDKSLLRQTPQRRFFLLETIREFAREQLDQSDEARELRERHARHYLALAEAYAEQGGDAGADVFSRLELEHDNLRAALGHFLAAGQLELEQRLAVALYVFWEVRGHFGEGQRWLEADWSSDSLLRAKALARAASLAFARGEYAEADRLLAESAPLYERLGDHAGTFHVLTNGGVFALRVGNRRRAQSLLTQALEFARDRDDEEAVHIAECNLGYAALTWGDNEGALRLLTPAKAKAEQLSDRRGAVLCAQNLGFAMLALDRLEEAEQLLREGLESARALGYRAEAAYCLEGLAAVEVERGRWPEGARLLAAADRILSDLGAARELAEHELHERTQAILERHLSKPARAAAEAEATKLTFEDAIAMALGEA